MSQFRCSAQKPQVESPTVEQMSPLDLSHYFSRMTKARQGSKEKDLYKYLSVPGIANLADGLQNASYFPFDVFGAGDPLFDSFEPASSTSGSAPPKTFGSRAASVPPSSTIMRQDSLSSPTAKINISSVLQCRQLSGCSPLLYFVRQFTRENLHPSVPYAGGPEVVLTNGDLDGLSKALECLSNPWDKGRDWVCDREGILCEEFTSMNSIQAIEPRGLKIVPVKIDSEGMLSSGPGGLRDILDNWDTQYGKQPHLLYTVTIGQSPTSAILSTDRRREIYSICSKYDIVIIEDDPYWNLQYPSAASSEASARNFPPPLSSSTQSPTKSSGFSFLDSLVPSYLSMDTDGRVIRLDTFSTTIAPGCRLGWLTAQPNIIDRLVRITEGSSQSPSDFVQAMVAKIIMVPCRDDPKSSNVGWEVDRWVRWLERLRKSYERRMQLMSATLDEGRFAVQQMRMINDEDAEWAVVKKVEMYTFSWPRGGIFVWLHYNFSSHPLFGQANGPRLAKALWVWLAQKPYLALGTPGQMLASTPEIAATDGWKYVRLCFASVEEADIPRVSVRYTKGVEAFWQLNKMKDIEGIEVLAARDQKDLDEMADLRGSWVC